VPTELVWDGTYKDGEKSGSLRINLPFQGVEGGGKRQGMRDALADKTTAESASDVPQ